MTWHVKKLVMACALALCIRGASTGIAAEPSKWRPIYVTESAVLDLVMLDDGTGWAVGEAGTILRREKQTWHGVISPTAKTLHSVAFASEDKGWAVGEAGTILHFSGSDWKSVDAPTTAADQLFDVSLLDDANGWAVGQRFNTTLSRFEALILRLRDGTWEEVVSPTSKPLEAVTLLASDEGWAVGKVGTILHWDGLAWTQETSPAMVDLFDVTVVGDDLWAVGEGGFIVQLSPQGARVVGTPHGRFTAVGFSDAHSGWTVGVAGKVLHYDGNTWTPISLPIEVSLAGLFIDDAGIPWITGAGGLIGRMTPDGWQPDTQPYVNVDLTAIDMPGATAAGWAVGSEPSPAPGHIIFWHHQTQRWDPQQIDMRQPQFDVDVLSAEEAWAVGAQPPPSIQGAIWHYSDGQWKAAVTPEVSALFAVEAVASNDVWVAGEDGSLAHFDGSDWQVISIPENVRLDDLHFRTPSDGWAVGRRLELDGDPKPYTPAAFHFDGQTWTEISVPIELTGPSRLLAVHALAESNVWAVGDAGAILHYDGDGWTVLQQEASYDLLELDFSGLTDGWAVGTLGTILRFNGITWTRVSAPTDETLRDVVSRPWGEAWAVGSQGTFLYRPPDARVYLSLIGR